MQIVTCKGYEEMSLKAAELAAAAVRENPAGLISFPAGDTPTGMVKQFVQWVNDGQVDIAETRYVMLDEWQDLGVEDEGSCAYFNETNLFSRLQKPFRDVCRIDGKAADPETERQALGNYLLHHGPLALSVLGIGMNGHLGFNEEGVDFEQDAIVTPLSPTTKAVMKKYFGDNAHPEFGISIGIRQLMAAKTVVLIASGHNKAEIVARTVKGPVSNEVPSSIMQRHPNCTLVLDEAAAGAL